MAHLVHLPIPSLLLQILRFVPFNSIIKVPPAYFLNHSIFQGLLHYFRLLQAHLSRNANCTKCLSLYQRRFMRFLHFHPPKLIYKSHSTLFPLGIRLSFSDILADKSFPIYLLFSKIVGNSIHWRFPNF